MSRLTPETFEAGQLANSSSVGDTVSNMAARYASGDDELAKLVRRRQDAMKRLQALDKKLVGEFSQPPSKRNKTLELNIRKQLKTINNTILVDGKELLARFPKFALLTSPQPLSVIEAQSLMGTDEALVMYLVDQDETFLWNYQSGWCMGASYL